MNKCCLAASHATAIGLTSSRLEKNWTENSINLQWVGPGKLQDWAVSHSIVVDAHTEPQQCATSRGPSLAAGMLATCMQHQTALLVPSRHSSRR